MTLRGSIGDDGQAEVGSSSGPHVEGRHRLQSQLYGSALLLLCSLLWASGGPATRYLFLLPTPPSAALLTACVSVITATFLWVGLLGSAMEGQSGGGMAPQPGQEQGAGREGGRSGAATTVRGFLWRRPRRQAETAADGNSDAEEEAEAEALLFSSMHAMGAAAGAVGAASALRRVTRERQRAHEEEAEVGTVTEAQAGAEERVALLSPLSGRSRDAHMLHGGAGSAHPDLESRHAAAGPRPEQACTGSGANGSASGMHGLQGVGSPRPGGAELPYRGSGARPPSIDGIIVGPKSSPPPPQPWPPGAAHLPSTPRASGGGAAGGGGGRVRLRLLTVPAASLSAAGLELGLYNVAAAALGAWGMQRISATRAAFLAQATALVTPAMVWLGGGSVGLPVWAACVAGAAGSAMVALDSSAHEAAAAAEAAAAGAGGAGSRNLLGFAERGAAEGAPRVVPSSTGAAAAAGSAAGGVESAAASVPAAGAAYVLLSCVFWGLATVRLGVHGARYPPLRLAAAAAAAYAGLALLWLSAEALGSPAAGQSDYLELGLLVRDHLSAALLLWAGLGPGALSSYLQVLGQQTVPPAQTQVLFSSTPLWSALIAQLLVPGEAMGPLAWAGGAVMLGASLLASLMQ